LAVFFSLVDLVTTSMALGVGMVETNFVVLALASILQVSELFALGLFKALLLVGCVAVYGMGVLRKATPSRSFWVLTLCVLCQGAAAVSNLLQVF